MRRKVRTLRHWKQRFHKDAEFVWRRPVTYAGEGCRPGDLIPNTLMANKAKLRRFWESGTIELAQFEEPNVLTGQVESFEDRERQLELAHALTRANEAAADFADEDEDEEGGVNDGD